MSGIKKKKKKIMKHEKKQEKINHKQDKRIIRYKVQNYRDDGIRRMFEKLKIFSICQYERASSIYFLNGIAV